MNINTKPDLICFSHLRWNFVYQRPQHLLSRFAKHFRVFYIEEPFIDSEKNFLEIISNKENVSVIIPHLSKNLCDSEIITKQKELLSELFIDYNITNYLFWYYTPLALQISDHFAPDLIIYDCMDELSAFKNAPIALKEKEKELMQKADIVFTGGNSLYEAKKHRHKNIYSFPSSIDKEHFHQARFITTDPHDQAAIPHPRIGFFGVIDERMNIELLDKIAVLKPEWHFVIIGPVVKIDPAVLPVHNNVHYLGGKSYNDLPFYLSGWDIAMMPFAINESTTFISPTKTPEYLAAGKPVISTSIKDVVNPYGVKGLVCIADTSGDFVDGIEKELQTSDRKAWQVAVDAFLSENSWDQTWEKMMYHINNALDKFTNDKKSKIKEKQYV